MNRSEQISKLVKANRKRSRVRPLAWGSRGRKEGGDAFHDFSDSNNSSEIENDTKEARQNLKRARLQRRKDQLLLQRQNSDSSSDDIPSENDLLQEEVPLLNPEVPEENEQDISSESINANAAEITNDTDQSESSNGPDVPESLDIRDIPEHINSSPESNLSSVEMTDGGNSNASSTSESSNFTLEDFAKDWSLIQMGHHCSNAVAEAFFKFAFEKCELISELKKENGGKIPCLSHLRRKLNEEHVHGIKMDFLFYDLSLCEEERSNNEIHVMNVDVKPQKRYPCDKYLLIYQVAKIEPKHLVHIHMNTCEHHVRPTKVVLSVDGVAETKSSRRSLEVVSLQFSGCREVYPCFILRPEVDQKKHSKDAFDAYLSVFLDELVQEGLELDKAVADAPERANLRKQKLYGGYSSCDLCLANPENIRNEKGTGSKRVFRPFMRFSTRRNHLDTLEWAQEVENGSVAEKNGILGKSILFQVPGFDVIQDLLPEAMHLLDAGFMKNTCGRTFNQGKSPQTRSTYRRAPVEELSKRLRETKFPSDFPRRSREYDFSNFKCHEWRQMGLFMFPAMVNALGNGYGSEKSVFIAFGFLNRAVRMPDEEYHSIDPQMFEDAVNILNEHYEKAYGMTAGSYNYHIVGSHLKELREHGPLTEYTAYPFEGMYSELRHCYTPGSPNICKQIMQKLLMRKYRSHTKCETEMKPIRTGSTTKSRDDLVYVYKDENFTLYQVQEVLENDWFECVELNTEDKFFTRHGSLNFGRVGVFKDHGLTTIIKRIHISEIAGKVVSNMKLLFTVPMNILKQT